MGIRTRARARAQAEQWSAVALPQKLAMLLADALLEHSEGYGPAKPCSAFVFVGNYMHLSGCVVQACFYSRAAHQSCSPFKCARVLPYKVLNKHACTGHGQAGDLDVDSEWEEVSDYDSVGQNDCAGGFGYVPACNWL